MSELYVRTAKAQKMTARIMEYLIRMKYAKVPEYVTEWRRDVVKLK